MSKPIVPIRTIAELATATPVEVDTALAELDERQRRVSARILALQVGLKHHTTEDALKRFQIELDESLETFGALHRELGRLEGEFERRGGWTRYIAVNDGHVHAGWFCRGGSVRWNTPRDHYPALSGATVEQAVEALKTTMCTKCFPQAPVASQPVDPDRCEGSGRYVDREAGPHGLRQAYSKWATCPGCKTRQTVTSSFHYRTHDTPSAIARKLAEKAKAEGKLVVKGKLKTVRAVELAVTDPYRDDVAERKILIAVLAAHRGDTQEQVTEWANMKRMNRR